MNNLSEDHVVIEPELTMEPEGPNTKATSDEPPPQDHNIDEQVEVDSVVQDDKPPSPVRTDDGPSSPVKATNIPSTPKKLLVTRKVRLSLLVLATPLLAILLFWQNIVPRKNVLPWKKANGAPIYQAMPTSVLKNSTLAF